MNFLKCYDINNNIIVYNPKIISDDLDFLDEQIIIDNLNQNTVYYIISCRSNIKSLASFLKLNSLLRVCNSIDITVVDKINNNLRFNVNYQLLSVVTNTRYILSTFVSESHSIISLQTLYQSFNWAEREVWDMYGIFISKHSDLRRILTDYGFVGFPLRKDFPLSGFKEVQYEDSIKQVEYSNTELSQSYRLLSFSSVWN